MGGFGSRVWDRVVVEGKMLDGEGENIGRIKVL